jgi:maltoporin
MEAVDPVDDSSYPVADQLHNEQLWGEARGLIQGNTVSFWAGKRFYRPDGDATYVNIWDARFLGGNGGYTGVGVDNYDPHIGGGKLSYAFFTNSTFNTYPPPLYDYNPPESTATHFLSLVGQPVNPGGSVSLAGSYALGGANCSAAAVADPNSNCAVEPKAGTPSSASGFGLYAWHRQSFASLYGGANRNVVAGTYSTGAVAISGPNAGGDIVGAPNAPSGLRGEQIHDDFWADFSPNWSGEAAVAWGARSGAASSGVAMGREWRLAFSPEYHMSQHVSFMLEMGFDSLTPHGAATETAYKVTFAPILRPGRGYWDRPELRAFVSFSSWNQAARLGPGTVLAPAGYVEYDSHGNPTSATSGTSFGVQMETWW